MPDQDPIVIVVPCYNEAERFDSEAFGKGLDAQEHLSLVLVNDGSTDDTLGVLRSFASKWEGRVEVLDQQPNAGKAEAVRVGMLHAIDNGAHFAGYWDADLATPMEAIPGFVAELAENDSVDIVMGARVALLGRDIERSPFRHYAGRVFATLASLVLGLPVYDTQCGAKLMRCHSGVRRLFERAFSSRWIFDVEMLARYRQSERPPESGYGIAELPLRKWEDVAGSKVTPSVFVRAFGELVSIHREYKLVKPHQRFLDVIAAPFLRYVGAGAVGTAIHYTALMLLVSLLGGNPVTGTIVGAILGAIVNYGLNYHLTFASNAPHSKTLPRFLIVATFGIGVNAAVMWLLSSKLGISYLLAQIAGTACVLGVGFVLNRKWTFGRDSEDTPSTKEPGNE